MGPSGLEVIGMFAVVGVIMAAVGGAFTLAVSAFETWAEIRRLGCRVSELKRDVAMLGEIIVDAEDPKAAE